MANISSNELAGQILDCCLHGSPWSDKTLLTLLEEANGDTPQIASRALFTGIVERLGDLFEPRLCDTYAQLFSEVIAYVRPEFSAGQLLERYRRIRKPRRAPETARNIFVLSRITLGADVAVTSVILSAIKQRYPAAKIFLVGPRKNWELFAADPRIQHCAFTYGRNGSLRERLASPPYFDNGIVIDPDSRITQLGLLPVCPDENYYFFESRAYGQQGTESLSILTSRWAAEVFGVNSATPFVAPLPNSGHPDVTVSLGVGENQEKRIEDPFEQQLLAALLHLGRNVLIDKGAGGEEEKRIENILSSLPGIESWRGGYAPFASRISRSKLYIGYDSAGQHVAAACGIPLLSIFAGYVSERMFQRWRPTGPGRIEIVKVTDPAPATVLQQTLERIDTL